ncbi:MAG: hypothetical protein K0S76_274 [Herbinix sp.]|jgi:hypothetical protein|nr:hypothetical protein [Herbinix sp.]
MSRKFIVIVITAAVLMLFAGCNLNKKIGENITEGILNKIGEEEGVDVDVKDGSIKFSSEDGDVTFNTEENGDFTIESDEGNMTFDAEDGNMTIEDNDGDTTYYDGTDLPADTEDGIAYDDEISDDDNNGDFNMETDEGSMSYDDDNGEFTITGEDGEVMTISENNEWPTGLAADLIPKFDGGVVTYCMNLNTGCLLTVEEVEPEEYKNYLEEVKKAGFNKEAFETNSDEMLMYVAYLDEKCYIGMYYYLDEKGMQITISLE